MQIQYRTKKLEKLANKASERQKKLGSQRAKNFEKRISELKAAECLEDIRYLPQAKPHELKEDRKGQFAVNLSGNWRLVFIPTDEPEPRTEDGGWDWNSITIVEITEIVDYHGQ